MSNKELIAKSSAPTNSDLDWIEHVRKEQQQSPQRMEDTAKYLAAIISISLTIFLNQSTTEFSSLAKQVLNLAVLLWGGAAVISFFVIFPWAYRYNPESPESIRNTYKRITRIKRWLLITSVLCYLIALGLGILAFIRR